MGRFSHAADAPASTPSDDTPTSVYRYFDKRGLLLYVGVTSRGITRNREHNTTKEWWGYVVTQLVDHYPSREQALRAEKALIVKHRPPFNTAHNPESHLIRATYLSAVMRPSGKRKRPQKPDRSSSMSLERIGDEGGWPAYRTPPGLFPISQRLFFTGNAPVLLPGGDVVGHVSRYAFRGVAGVVRLKMKRPGLALETATLNYYRNSNDPLERLRINSVLLWNAA